MMIKIEEPKLPEKGEAIVLIIPVGVKPPQDFPIKIVAYSDDRALAESFSEYVLGEVPVVFEIPADFATLAIQLARFLEVEIRVLVGFTGDYPAYWNATTSVLPIAISSEIMIARDESQALGGTGVPTSKKPRDEMKPDDAGGIERRLAVLASLDVTNKVKMPAKPSDDKSLTEEDVPANTED